MIAPVLEELSKTLDDVVFLKVGAFLLSVQIHLGAFMDANNYTLIKGGRGRC